MAELENITPLLVRTADGSPGSALRITSFGFTCPIFHDPEMEIPAANPVVADANGEFPVIWIESGTSFGVRAEAEPT